jgi:hypothetical protein
MYIQGSPAEIQTPAHWNLIGHSMTAPPPVLSPSSILRLIVLSIPQGKIGAVFITVTLSISLIF